MRVYSKDEARAAIAALVADFQKNEAALKDVAEAQIENNYLRPLFRYLNWNVDNAGLAEPQWEFVLQRTARTGKRPDYVLRLEGQDLLVMDAKKVKYDMHDPRWVNQVYAYAYSTQNNLPPKKIDFAILTDFEEFVVLDCTLYAARPEAANNFRVLDWRCTDYVEQFDTLWELFERNNLLAASRERQSGLWARYLSPKKVKANRIPPDKAFLAALDDEKTGWRVRLAKDMKRLNPGLDGDVITAAVQLLIDRLIFVKVLSDREIEDDYLAQMAEIVEQDRLADDDRGWFAACRNIFAKLNQIYNGSVFAPRPELEAVEVSNKTVREIIRDLQPENSPYNFAVLPVEILGTIYERFLGRVVRATDSRVKIEDKPEVRKAGGVYYTPQYIVNYIVENTVGKLLAECETPADVARLKILDPACGSGSFLLGAYEALIRWHEQYYREKRLTHRDREAAYYNSDNGVRLTAKLKRQILLNNLYGVDIDPQAVEVTRFSLSLKALEDTRRDELHEEVTLFKQTVLPDLSDNIKCGNSLIGTDFFERQSPLGLETSSHQADDTIKINAFDWEVEFREVMKAGGFDAVIGNPPYLFAGGTEHSDYFNSKYLLSQYQTDFYVYFVERALALARSGGKVSYIVSDSWLNSEYFSKLRNHFLMEHRLDALAVFEYPVFAQANLENSIFVVTVSEKPKEFPIIRFSNPNNFSIVNKIDPRDAVRLGLIDPHWSASAEHIIAVMEQGSQPLERYAKLNRGIHAYRTDGYGKSKFGSGPQTKKDKELKSYHAPRPLNKTYLPELKGKDVDRFTFTPTGEYLSYGPWLAEPREPEFFFKSKIAIRKVLGRKLHGTFIEEPTALDQSLYVLISTNDDTSILKYLLGVLLSRLGAWYLRTKYAIYDTLYPWYTKKQLATFPIKPPDDRMVRLVERMLALHKQRAAAKTEHAQTALQRQIDATDREFDRLVYDLYELTEEEVAVVEGGG